MESEEYEKVLIEENWGMNIYQEKLKMELFYKHEGNWKPVFKITLLEDFEECFLIYLYGSKDDTIRAYPFESKKKIQQLVNVSTKILYNVDWRLPPVVTDILDSWLLMRSIV